MQNNMMVGYWGEKEDLVVKRGSKKRRKIALYTQLYTNTVKVHNFVIIFHASTFPVKISVYLYFVIYMESRGGGGKTPHVWLPGGGLSSPTLDK